MNQQSANIVERKVIVRTGVVLYTISSSSSDYTYFITVTNGRVDLDTHQDCPGCAHGLRCFHVRDIEAMEGQIRSEAKFAAHMVAMTEQYASDPRQSKQTGLAESYKAEWYRKEVR